MPRSILVLCDERDLDIAEALRDALVARGHEAKVEPCDAAAETLGAHARDRLAGAAKVIVVVREGGRGNRLLHAAEDEARAGTEVLLLLADPSPDGAPTERTTARIQTLVTTLFAGAGGHAPRKRNFAPWLAALFAAVVLALIAGAWLRCSPAAPPGGPPVVLTGMLSNAGWLVTFHLREEASLLEYKRPEDRDFVSTGDLGPTSGPTMSQPHAKTYAVFTDLRGKVPFQVRYRTLEGANRGPFDTVFDTDAESVSSVKGILRDVPGWVSFRAFAGRRLCYFTMLLTYKYALRSIRWGIDTDSPDRSLRFAPRGAPGIDNDDEMLVDLPDRAGSVSVELTFLDGTTEKKRFPVQF